MSTAEQPNDGALIQHGTASVPANLPDGGPLAVSPDALIEHPASQFGSDPEILDKIHHVVHQPGTTLTTRFTSKGGNNMSQKVTIERTLQIGTPERRAEPELPDVFTHPGKFFRQSFNFGLAVAIAFCILIVLISVLTALIEFIARS